MATPVNPTPFSFGLSLLEFTNSIPAKAGNILDRVVIQCMIWNDLLAAKINMKGINVLKILGAILAAWVVFESAHCILRVGEIALGLSLAVGFLAGRNIITGKDIVIPQTDEAEEKTTHEKTQSSSEGKPKSSSNEEPKPLPVEEPKSPSILDSIASVFKRKKKHKKEPKSENA